MAFVQGQQFNVFEDIFISFENDIDEDGNDQLTIEYVGQNVLAPVLDQVQFLQLCW